MKTTASALAALVFGVIFGLGLVLSHMIDPARVDDFLDVTGNWNPSLAFVMAGAILVAAPAFAIARKHPKALLGPIELPDRFRIDPRLVIGAAIFGFGWGLSGICPGPGIVLLGSLEPHAIVFVSSVAIGIWVSALIRADTRIERQPEAN